MQLATIPATTEARGQVTSAIWQAEAYAAIEKGKHDCLGTTTSLLVATIGRTGDRPVTDHVTVHAI